MSQYQDGTVSVTNGSNVVTGSGTLWLANISIGDLFTKEGDKVAYTVASVPSDTQITLTGNYGGATSSGSNYGITIEFTSAGYPLLSDGDLNTGAIYNEAMRLISNSNIANLKSAAYADKIGLVSSGAIIESGSNANGYYTKFIDGTLLVYNIVYTGSVVMVGQGALSNTALSLPTPFPSVIPFTVSGGGNNSIGDGWISPSATKTGATISFNYWSPFPAAGTIPATDLIVSAIGRWF